MTMVRLCERTQRVREDTYYLRLEMMSFRAAIVSARNGL
jgi:hypothetical protein